MQSGIDSLLRFLRELSELMAALLIQVEYWLRGQMQDVGVPPLLQTMVLVSVAILLIVGAVRFFAGLVRVAVVLVLVLLALHLLTPTG